MKTRVLPLTLLICSAFVQPAAARVGETETQCIARYGKPLRQASGEPGRSDKVAWFRKSAFDLCVLFDKGRAVSVTYTRTPKLGRKAAITPAEQTSLMRANSGSKSWRELRATKADDRYETFDRKMGARYNRGKKYLEVFDGKWREALKQAKKTRSETEAAAAAASAELKGL
jgi:hypothetical protein